MRLKLSESDSLGSRGVNDPLQFVFVVNVGHKPLRHFRNSCRQRYVVDEAAADGVAVETAERVVLTAPVAVHRASSSQEHLHLFGPYLAYVDLHSHASAKRIEQALRTLELCSHRLPECRVLDDQFSQLHSKPPKSKSATCRSPAKSSLA